jgi:hypothetical protein
MTRDGKKVQGGVGEEMHSSHDPDAISTRRVVVHKKRVFLRKYKALASC